MTSLKKWWMHYYVFPSICGIIIAFLIHQDNQIDMKAADARAKALEASGQMEAIKEDHERVQNLIDASASKGEFWTQQYVHHTQTIKLLMADGYEVTWTEISGKLYCKIVW